MLAHPEGLPQRGKRGVGHGPCTNYINTEVTLRKIKSFSSRLFVLILKSYSSCSLPGRAAHFWFPYHCTQPKSCSHFSEPLSCLSPPPRSHPAHCNLGPKQLQAWGAQGCNAHACGTNEVSFLYLTPHHLVSLFPLPNNSPRGQKEAQSCGSPSPSHCGMA